MKREKDLVLFRYGEDGVVTYGMLVDALRQVDADQCDVLFLHTELSFGAMNRELKRKELMEILYDAICELGVKTLVFPTFTFSYGNREVYDVRNSKTKMGMFNEYVRKLPGAVRSMDPMLSACVIGEDLSLAEVTGNHSLGEGSIFSQLHRTPNVRILFLGTRVGQCYTHMHYVEEHLRVPYRYDKEFEGEYIDAEGVRHADKRVLYVKYRDIIPVVPPAFEEELIDEDILKMIPLGESFVSCFTEKESYDKTVEWLKKDVNCFLGEPYDTKEPVKEYSYGNVTTVQ